MRVELKSLKPNPKRDFTIDPLDEERVKELSTSIKDHGFWGGVVCRRTKHNGIEVGGGWHRIKAAMKAGLDTADLFVGEFTDLQMIKVYADENALQRGNISTAIAGSVAAALRHQIKNVLIGTSREITGRSLESARGNITTEKGVGADLILQCIGGTPGINENTVKQQLANLRSSGDYARIMREVQEEIEEENKEALKALERAEREKQKAEEAAAQAKARQQAAEEQAKEAAKANRLAKEDAARKQAEADAKRAELERQRADAEAKLAAKRKADADAQMKDFEKLKITRDTANAAANKAEGREKTFDFEGVAKHLKNASHVDVFRALVTGEGVRPYLPVSGQAGVAARLVKLAGGENELTGRFIRENFMDQLTGTKQAERKLDAEAKAALARQDWSAKMKDYQHNFARQAQGCLAAATKIAEIAKKRPSGVSLHVTTEFRTAVQTIKRAVALMEKAGVA